jgi:DNA-binding beta-propeller fold protein YncE
VFAPLLLLFLALRFSGVAQTSPAPAAAPPTQDYLVYVVCESADKIVLIRFGPSGAKIESQMHIGLLPMDVNGPHGVAVSPDKQYFYVSVGHGRPDGSVWKYRAGTDEVIKYTSLGLFPATTDITPDGNFIYVANANFHGDMVPSSISVVATDQMVEVKRIPTCTMPHGSRLNHAGTKHYSVCMMDDMLAEIDTRRFAVDRYFMLSKGKEMGMMGAHDPRAMPDHKSATCTPTWAQPSNDGSIVYVACNQSNEIVAIKTDTWTLARRFPAGTGVYNLAMTKDGRLIATNKRGQSVSVFDPVTGRELAKIPTQRKVVHGAVVSPDDRYAFISVEGVGSEPGTVEVIDLSSLKTVATVDVPPQAAGIDFWKMEPGKQ